MSKQPVAKIPATKQIADMELKITETGARNLNGSLEQCKEELRDAYMNFKDLQQRCVIDMKESQKAGNTNQESTSVYYFKPETFLLDEPEKQRQFRETLLKKVSSIPKPEAITYLGDEIHRSTCQSIADRSTPKATKNMLKEFFKQRQYTLQHMKYKLLCRWAHHALTSETIEKISPEATFMYGKLEFNLEQAMDRLERLDQDDHYDKANPENRPSTRAELGQGALYVEKFDLAPQSLIREDDIEVFMRATSYKNKINKVANKFISRLKWVPMKHRYEIFEKAIEGHFNLKNQNIQRQRDMVERVTQRVHKTHIMTPTLQAELNQIINGYHCKQYDSMFLNNIELIAHGWKGNHDQVPGLISDQQLLKIKIQDSASLYNLTGDIELDHGYSFSYQVTVFFPSYFQKQVIKSQFSIYDAFAAEDDANKNQKRALATATRLDMNIFLDVSTTKHQVPSEEAFQFEFRNSEIKVIRLKSAAYWIHYISLQPTEPDWHMKQQAILNNENPIDTLLQQGFNFLDVNDLATVNRINEDNAKLHQENVRKLLKHNPHNFMNQTVVSTQDGDKKVTVDMQSVKNSLSVANNLEQHLYKAVQDNDQKDGEQVRVDTESLTNSIRHLPTHLLLSYNTLRFLSSRDAKTRIMYTLNYFRSIQKRLALDLREFATRDRIEGHLSNPFIQSKEANQTIINQSNLAAKSFDVKDSSEVLNIENQEQQKKMTVFDRNTIKEMKDMATFRGYKANGMFNNKIFSTCPSYPKFHSTHGEPLVKMSEDEESDRNKNGKSISEKAIKLMGRIDFVEINEKLKEVYVKDDFGIYIMYDCVLQDMKYIELELVKVGSYYINKSETLLDPETQNAGMRAYPFKDRLELIDDILKKEADFQFEKVKLVQVYIECYEHVCDPLEQQKLMQLITDLMSRRPRLNLNANYFMDAYDAEIICLQKQYELIKMLVDVQISLEKTENKRLQDALNLSYTLSNQYAKNKWKYQDAESLLEAIEKTRKDKADAEAFVKNFNKNAVGEPENLSKKHSSQISNNDAQQKSQTSQPKITDLKQPSQSENRPIDDGLSSDVSIDEAEYYKNDENQFTQLLGLPQITIETIYQGYREKDKNVIKLMREHSNFIAVYEGYPEFLTMLTHQSILDKNRIFKPNKWSQETGALDFYDTLDFVIKFYAVTQQIQQELYDGLKMWDATLMTQIDIQVAEIALQEYKQICKFMEGESEEYEGRKFIEDDSIMGNSEKMIFFAKEMISDLTSRPKHLVDPYLIAKLDVQSINFFDFPLLNQNLNKYTMRKNGIAGAEYMEMCEKEAITQIAKQKSVAGVNEMLGGKVGDVLNRRNITVPSMLQTYLNMIELHRLRNELILAATETAILQDIYVKQCELVGQRNTNTQIAEGITFDQLAPAESEIELVNYIDHGPSHQENIGLAVREFDKALLSNLNFRNPDSFKLNILTTGLEELRAVLYYQLLQKQLLIVATRSNLLVTDSYQRAFAELNLIERSKIAIPNSIVHYSQIFNKNQDNLNIQNVKMLKQSYKQGISANCAPVFYNILNKKNQNRTSIAKEFSNYQTTTITAFPLQTYCVLRVMRCFKVKLLTKFVTNLITEVCLDAQKIQALQACQRLRNFNRYFSFEPKILGMSGESPQVLKYETCSLIENFPSNYTPDFLTEEKDKFSQSKNKEALKVIGTQSYEILDYFGIPSSVSLLQTDATSLEDLRVFRDKRKTICFKSYGKNYNEELKDQPPELNDPEIHLKQLLPTFTPQDESEQNTGKKSAEEFDQMLKKKIGQSGSTIMDYEEALYFGDSLYGNMIRYYLTLERVIMLEWFINKLQFRSDEVINLELALDCGLPFWKEDEFDQRIKSQIQTKIPESLMNQRSQQFFFDKIVSYKSKRNFAETINSLSLTLKSFIQQYLKTKPELRAEYLTQYVEFRYQQIAGSLHKLVQQFYYQKNIQAVQNTQHAIAKLTKMEHVRFKALQPNNYSVNMSLVHPLLINLEPGNLISGSIQHDEILNYKRSVQPIINEKALEPSQITLFQALYQQDYLRRGFQSQYAGQLVSTSNSVAFKSLETALLSLNTKERQYSQSFIVQAKYQANDFMETVFGDTSMASLTNEDVYSLSQLVDAKKFINEGTQALLLRNALICWFENSVLPNDCEVYDRFEKNFRQNYFWKQLEQKEDLAKKLQHANTFGQIPTESQLKELKNRIDTMVNDHNLATQSEIEKRDALVKVLREEFASLKKKVTLDNYFSTKSEIQVFSNEIEKFVIKASVKTLDSECAALAKCFTMQIPQIQYHIHPFQQFAATFFDYVDPNMHLDISNKVTAIQSLITKMRNRGTEVETLTSGPGMVFTTKDINEILIDFCNTTIKDQEKQFKSRIETFKLTEDHYRNLLYMKDQKINSLEHRIKNIGINLENIIDARLFEKGNQLIYELDSSNRVLNLFKNSIFGLERSLQSTILGEQLHKFKRIMNQVEMKNQKFADYKKTIFNMVQADFATEEDKIKTVLKDMADYAKNTEREETTIVKKQVLYPIKAGGQGVRQDNKGSKDDQSANQNQSQQTLGTVVPKGFVHYPSCNCYLPSEKYPRPTLELAELDMLSEQEARSELARLCILVRKQRLLYRTKEMCLMTRYQDKINLLEKQLNSNQDLWQQLAESQKRERVLKQELLLTQQSVSTSEKVIEKMKEEIKNIDAERGRLAKFKSGKVEKLKELEDKVKKIDIFDNIDSDKLIVALTKKDAQVKDLKSVQDNYQGKIAALERRKDQEVNFLKKQFQAEQQKTQSIVDKMDQMKLELKMLEANDTSVASIWKKKCLDLFEVCQSMKLENDELRGRCKELIEQGLTLANAMTESQQQDSQLPNLTITASAKRLQSQGGKLPARGQLVSTANTMQRSVYYQDTPQDASVNYPQYPVYDQIPSSAPWQMKSPDLAPNKATNLGVGYHTHYAQRGKTQAPQNDIKSILSGSTEKYLATAQTQKAKVNGKNQSTDFSSSVKSQFQNAVNRRKNNFGQHEPASINATTNTRLVTTAEPLQMMKLKGVTRLARIEQPLATFDLQGKALLNPKLQPASVVPTIPGKIWTSLQVNGIQAQQNVEDSALSDTNQLQSSQRVTNQAMQNNNSLIFSATMGEETNKKSMRSPTDFSAQDPPLKSQIQSIDQ